MSNDHRRASWALASDPFYPDVLGDGSALPRQSWESDLKPTIDPKVMSLFFDVYDWSNSPFLTGLTRGRGFSSFPTARTLPTDAPLLVLISGPSHSGLDSLANLVTFSVADALGRPLIETCVRLEGRDAGRNTLKIAKSLVDDVEYGPGLPKAEQLAARMRERLERSIRDEAGRADATYSDVFRAYSKILAPAGHGVFIRILSGGDHDSWGRIYKASRELASCVVVTTPDAAFAKTCYEAMTTDRQNATWIRAQPLDLEMTRRFVEERLAVVRLPGAPGANTRYHPFTDAAIDVLFQPGVQRRAGVPVTHPIGWVRRTLHRALEEVLEEIRNKVPAGDAPSITGHPDFPFSVDTQWVVDARNKLNRGDNR